MEDTEHTHTYIYTYKCIYTHTHICTQLLGHIRLCGPVDCSQLDFSVHGIFQAKILERVVPSSFRGLPDLGMKPHLLCLLQADFFLPLGPPGKPIYIYMFFIFKLLTIAGDLNNEVGCILCSGEHSSAQWFPLHFFLLLFLCSESR